ncbi:hypothetical protein C8Q80DRAFT_1265870 [Daedaleopsis nitida]|nr:hypothetical protein C8Q80DRAFT_1265870 [Daedaleopsis nitida]
MSSPIAIPRVALSDARVDSQSSPTGLYVPVHRRTPSASSASSLSSSFDDGAHLGLAPNAHRGRRSPAPRTRSVSPAFARQHDHSHMRRPDPITPATPTTFNALCAPAPIPQASKIPNVYSLTELLALSSSPLVGLSEHQLDAVRAHIPFMTRKSSSPSASSKSKPKSKPSSASSSPTASPAPNPAPLEEHSPAPAPAPVPVPAPVASEKQRRLRRTARRNAPSGKPRPRVSPAVSTDVESRRRRGANGAGWGWASAPSDGANWRLVSVASA